MSLELTFLWCRELVLTRGVKSDLKQTQFPAQEPNVGHLSENQES